MKNKNKNKNNKLIISLMVIVLLLVSATIFILNYSSNDTSLTIVEKKWLTENSNKMLDVSTYNDIPIYGENGRGIIFDFLDSITEKYNLTFNKVSYLTSSQDNQYKDISFKVIPGSAKLANNDILMYTDYYGLLSLNNQVFLDNNEINNLKIGILEVEKDRVNYYLGSDNNTYTTYKTIDELENAIKDKKIDYIILPINQFITEIQKNNYLINYKFASYNNKYILTINNDTLYSIFNKHYITYLSKDFTEDYGEEFLNTYFTSLEIADTDKENYNAQTYSFGYITENPLIGNNDNEITGILGRYLNSFETIANVEFEYNKYNSISELKNNINNNRLDFIYSPYFTNESENTNLITASIPVNKKYVVLSKEYFNIDSLQGLNNYDNIYTIKDSYLDELLKTYQIKTNSYQDSDELFRNISNESIVVIDYNTYKFYSENKFNDYKVIFTKNIADNYKFILNNNLKNNTFNGLFKTYLYLVDFDTVSDDYNNNLSNVTIEQVKRVSKYLLILFSIVFIFLLIIYIILNKKKKQKLVKRHDKLKYIDMMTSLKNRNYLNEHIKEWTESKRFPKAVIVVDLNNIKYINDNYGHEEGDNVIKKAANILIINQLENTDIMRTDGNEFFIYLLGYNEKQVVAYCRKIFKDLKELPHGFGATLGHSMILDDIKTVEDAINEANIEMRNAKEKMK